MTSLLIWSTSTVTRGEGGMLPILVARTLRRLAAATWYFESELATPRLPHVTMSVRRPFDALLETSKRFGEGRITWLVMKVIIVEVGLGVMAILAALGFVGFAPRLRESSKRAVSRGSPTPPSLLRALWERSMWALIMSVAGLETSLFESAEAMARSDIARVTL